MNPSSLMSFDVLHILVQIPLQKLTCLANELKLWFIPLTQALKTKAYFMR